MSGLTRRSVAEDVAIALVFFTRIPFPPFEIAHRKLGDAIWAAPIAGLAIAVLGAMAFTVGDILGMTSALAAAIALCAVMLATGCLHEDGLADTADAFGGGRTLERKLEIMHDSRLGTYGAAALMGSMLIRWAALASLTTGADVICALIAAHVGSRGMFGWLLRSTPLARNSGLAAAVGLVSQEASTAGLVIGALALLFLGIGGALIAGTIAAMAVYLFRQLAIRQIGGITGDTLGAAQQVAELSILAIASATLS